MKDIERELRDITIKKDNIGNITYIGNGRMGYHQIINYDNDNRPIEIIEKSFMNEFGNITSISV